MAAFHTGWHRRVNHAPTNHENRGGGSISVTVYISYLLISS